MKVCSRCGIEAVFIREKHSEMSFLDARALRHESCGCFTDPVEPMEEKDWKVNEVTRKLDDSM